MRRQMTVVGIGPKKAGIGKKSGKPFSFIEYSFIYDDDSVVGQKCETIAVDTGLIGDKKISVGDVLDIVCHQYNFKTTVDAIL